MKRVRLKSGDVIPLDGEPFELVCCDCGLVHLVYVAENTKTGQRGLIFFDHPSATKEVREERDVQA